MSGADLAETLLAALSSLVGTPVRGIGMDSTLADLSALMARSGFDSRAVLAEAVLASARPAYLASGPSARELLRFEFAVARTSRDLSFVDRGRLHLDAAVACEAVGAANQAIKVLHDVSLAYDVVLFETLGLRNLSSFVGEVFKDQLSRLMSHLVLPNPNQDGYPDLIALTADAKRELTRLERRGEMSAKEHFSPFKHGGIEVKATCGDTPPAHELAKPAIGKSRLPILRGLNWKAHHRHTNNLIGVVWDFVDRIPTILALFYRNDLTPSDWGKTVTPREGSRTTSVSIMKSAGVKKMGEGWLVLADDAEIRARLSEVMKVDLPASTAS